MLSWKFCYHSITSPWDIVDRNSKCGVLRKITLKFTLKIFRQIFPFCFKTDRLKRIKLKETNSQTYRPNRNSHTTNRQRVKGQRSRDERCDERCACVYFYVCFFTLKLLVARKSSVCGITALGTQFRIVFASFQRKITFSKIWLFFTLLPP